MVAFVTNTGHPGLVDIAHNKTEFPDEAREAPQEQCANQLVRTAGEVQNFSFIGILVVVCLGLFFVLVDRMPEPIAHLLSRWRGTGERTRSARQADDKLDLLRLVLAGSEDDSSKAWKLGRLGNPIRHDRAVDVYPRRVADVSLDFSATAIEHGGRWRSRRLQPPGSGQQWEE